MYGTIVYNNSAAAAGTENALSAAVDPDVTQQNSHYIFTGQYQLLAAAMVGASVEYGRYDVAEWNGRGRPNIFSANRGLTLPSNPQWDLYRGQNLILPQNQEILIHTTNNLASGTEPESVVLQIGTPDWSYNQPPGMYDMLIHATATITPTANAWLESQAITFDANPLGGVYVVLGAQLVGANALAWRFNFPRTRMYGGRRLRPGGLVLSSFGNNPSSQMGDPFNHWGVMGGYHTFEPPTIGVFGTSATSTTYHLFMKCRFLGQNISLLDNFVQSSY
jgi:hypothetical protein